MLFNVQVLRAIAALLVVHAHAAMGGGLNLDWDGGAHGVDLFFVISGFIIAHVSRLAPDRFLVRRLVRIVPIYWLATLVLYALVLALPGLFRSTSADPALLALSLLFLPAPWSVHASDGMAHPTLAGGWTLNYEMYFYAVFAVALAATRRRATLVAGLAIGAIVVLVNATALDASPTWHFYGFPVVLEFVLGMLAFHLVDWCVARPLPRHRAVPVGLLLVALAGLACVACAKLLFGDLAQWFASGLPSFLVVTAAVLLERGYGWRITNRVLVAIGDASYVLYLMHAYLLHALIRLALPPVQLPELAGQLVTLVLMAVCSAIAVAVHQRVERPLLRVVKRCALPAPRASAR